MSDTWYMDIESQIFTKVKGKTYSSLHSKYSNILYTTNDENVEPLTKFPTVYIHELSGLPVGTDLVSDAVNGVNATFEVRVTTNTNISDAKAVIKAISDAFISLGFMATSLPINTSNNDLFVYTARFRRVIGASDTI